MDRPTPDDPAAAFPEAGPDVLTLLLLQHRRLESLMRSRVLGVRPPDRHRTLAPVLDAFAAQIGAEAAAFYPALQALPTPASPPGRALGRLKDLAFRLQRLDPGGAEAARTCREFLDTVVAHHRHEERTAFPLVEQALSMDERERLGARVAEVETALRTGEPAGRDGIWRTLPAGG